MPESAAATPPLTTADLEHQYGHKGAQPAARLLLFNAAIHRQRAHERLQEIDRELGQAIAVAYETGAYPGGWDQVAEAAGLSRRHTQLLARPWRTRLQRGPTTPQPSST